MCRLALVLALSVLALGCTEGRSALIVDLKTDLVAGAEFAAVRVRVLDRAPGPGATQLAAGEVAALSNDDFTNGARIAELDGLTLGASVVLVTDLVRGDGALVTTQITQLTLDAAATAVTVLISRDCRGVTCPAGDPAQLACLGGACVDPACGSEQAGCAGECASDDDCAARSSCADARCVGGACFAFPTARCGADGVCDPDVGCVFASPCPAPDADTVLLHAFEAGSLADGAGAHDAVAIGALETRAGPDGCGDALLFPASGDAYAEIADDSAFDLTSGSVDFHFRWDSAVTGEVTLLSRDHSGPEPPGQLLVTLAEDRTMFVRIQGAEGEAFLCTEPGIAADEWHHVGINFGAPGVEVWLDGAMADRSGDVVVVRPGGFRDTRTCAVRASSSIAGGGGALPWHLGVSNANSSAGTTDNLFAFFARGAIDHLRVSRVRRDFGGR